MLPHDEVTSDMHGTETTSPPLSLLDPFQAAAPNRLLGACLHRRHLLLHRLYSCHSSPQRSAAATTTSTPALWPCSLSLL